MHTRIASIMLIASILGLGAIMAPITAVTAQEDITNAIAGGFASITTVQTGNQIIITITKDGGEAPPPEENATVPTDPIIIIPPNNETGENGTVIVPEPLPPTNETTLPGNVTEPPVIIVQPPGNITQVEPPSNVTVIDNGTVIVHPPDQNVTETPGNVTVIDPPPVNVTEPAPCGCPPVTEGPTLPINETSSQPVQPPVTGDNETIIIEQPPVAPNQDLPQPEDGGGDGGGNGDGNGGDGNGGG